MPMLLWLDLETTDLEPQRGRILEVAALLAHFNEPFKQTGSPIQMVRHFDARDREGLDPFIIDMHTKNGLFAACEKSTNTIHDIEQVLLRIVPLEVEREKLTILAGSSVHFDLTFIRVHMPVLARRLSHKCFDVSAFKLAAEAYGREKFPRAEAHRALDDIRESMDHGHRALEFLGTTFKAPRHTGVTQVAASSSIPLSEVEEKADVLFKQLHRGGNWILVHNRTDLNDHNIGSPYDSKMKKWKIETIKKLHPDALIVESASGADSPEALDWAEDRARGRLDD